MQLPISFDLIGYYPLGVIIDTAKKHVETRLKAFEGVIDIEYPEEAPLYVLIRSEQDIFDSLKVFRQTFFEANAQ